MNESARDLPIDRRTFVRTMAATAAASMLAAPYTYAQRKAAPGLTVGMILPGGRGDSFSDARAGIELGFEEAVRSGILFQKPVTVLEKTFTTPRDAADAAKSLIVGDRAAVLIGCGTDDEVRAMADVCDATAAVFMNVVSRSDDLRRLVCSRFLYHIEASEAMYVAGHALATHQTETGLAPADCELVLWHAALERYGAAQLNDRFSAQAHKPMNGASWAGWFGVKVATESYFRSGGSNAAALATFMSAESTQFDGHKGAPLSFRSWDHQLRQPLYCVSTIAGPGSPSVRDVPDLARSSGPSRQLLDQLGDREPATQCKRAHQ